MIKNMKMSVKWCQVLKDKNSRICERFFASTCVKVYFVKLSESENYKSDVIESKLESYQNENDRSGSTRRFRCWTSNLQSILKLKILKDKVLESGGPAGSPWSKIVVFKSKVSCTKINKSKIRHKSFQK